MKKKWTKIAILVGILLVIAGGVVLGYNLLGGKTTIVLDGDLGVDGAVEYTNEAIQFPMAHVENGLGEIISYDVGYEVENLGDNSVLEDEYAMFDLKPGKYELHYIYKAGKKTTKTVAFEIQDTQSPVITFTEVPNGLFLQDLDKDEPNKLPLYDIEDASKDDGIELTRTLMFKGEKDADFKEVTYRDMNNSYEISEFGQFKYVLTATDKYGNTGTNEAIWKVKDRDWKPEKALTSGYLADYATEGYTNYIEAGDANQYYQIGNDYSDAWLEEYEGAKGVFKIDMGFNNSAGYGNNTIRLHFANTFTQKDIEEKYLAVRLRVEGENLTDTMLFAGNNVEFRKEDSTTRAFSTTVSGVEVGQWKTYYIDAATVQAIGVYPNGTYNPSTTFYEGGDAAECLQLCFSRKAGYYNNMTVYIDSISIAEKLPQADVTISGNKATWKKVEGATGYLVNLNGKETKVTDTSYSLDGKKGYIRVTPLGDGALKLDGEESTAVYGINPGSKLAAFDDELYMDLISDHLNFSTAQEHEGYRPKSLEGKLTKNGLKVDIGTGNWGIVTGIRMLFPKSQTKGNNTTLVLNMNVSNAKYGNIRVYDYDGQLIQSIPLDDKNTGKMNKFEIDISAYDKELKGIQLVFGPKDMTAVADGVTVEFKEIYMANTYTKITIDGKTYLCAGEKTLVPGYTTPDVVQFTSFYNFGLAKDDTPLTFSGVLLLDGKRVNVSTFAVVGYPKVDTICFKVPHNGKLLTIKKGGIIHNGTVAVKVAEDFNMKWNGKEWVVATKVPATPKTEYVTVDGTKYELVNTLELVPGYTTAEVVQFTNVNDFGVKADDTALGFKGTVMVGGKKINNPTFVGYKGNTTICLKTPHKGKVVTILKDSVIYYGNAAIKVTKTFNMKWENESWKEVSKIPSVPKTEYVVVNGKQYELVNKVELEPGFTLNDLVQFTNVNDFGAKEDDTILGFDGTVMVDGKKINNPQVVGYKGSTTICLKTPHKDKVVTILKGAIIYSGKTAVKVTKTFNMKWDGKNWTAVAKIPEAPKDVYTTIDGKKYKVVAQVELEAKYTQNNLVQFVNVNDFGVKEDDTPLNFKGTVMIDGQLVNDVNIVGYKNNTTICLKAKHNKELLTILKDSVIYYGDEAVIVTKTFNAKWDGKNWKDVKNVPAVPKDDYITVDGKKLKVVAKTELTPGYTLASLVQFGDVYNFGVSESDTPLSFSGTVLVNGVKQENPLVVGYPNSTTICFKELSLKNKVLTVMKDSVIYRGTEAVVVKKTFNAKWDGTKWNEVKDIPTAPKKEYVDTKDGKKEVVDRVSLTAGYTAATLVQFDNFHDFGVAEENTKLGFDGEVLLDGNKVNTVEILSYPEKKTITLNNIAHSGKVVTVKADSVIYYGDKAVVVAETFNAKWNGSTWTNVTEVPQTVAEGAKTVQKVSFMSMFMSKARSFFGL